MRRVPVRAVVPYLAAVVLTLAAAGARAQDGGTADARERLEARQAARLQELGARRLLLAERAALRWRDGRGDARYAGQYGYGYGDAYGYDAYGYDAYGYDAYGYDAYGYDAYGYGYGYGYDGYGYAPGGQGYGAAGWGWRPVWLYPVPNPYRDWAGLWGRGWLDDAPVPPYHRFQYRFFPETLPDPTVGGYPSVPQGVAGLPGRGAPGVARPPRGPRPGAGPAARRCARIDLELVSGDATTVLVPLPTLGAVTPEALGSVIRDRLRGGSGVAVRDVDGYVFAFPPAGTIVDLALGGC